MHPVDAASRPGILSLANGSIYVFASDPGLEEGLQYIEIPDVIWNI